MTTEHVEELAQRLQSQAEIARGMIARGTKSGYGKAGVSLTPGDEQLLDRWINATFCIIRDNLGQNEAQRFSEAVAEYGRFRKGRLCSSNRCLVGAEFIESLVRICREFPSQLTYTEPALSRLTAPKGGSDAKRDAAAQPTQVFLIHGHDELNALKLEKHLRDNHGLTATILSDVAGKGRTLIEKFEEEALKAAYAFALLTPDDEVQTAGGQYAQARPNVAFELGWFYGRLGRSRVCVLLKKGTRLHSDLDGINRIEFEGSVDEVATEIERELRASALIK